LLHPPGIIHTRFYIRVSEKLYSGKRNMVKRMSETRKGVKAPPPTNTGPDKEKRQPLFWGRRFNVAAKMPFEGSVAFVVGALYAGYG
jgi:hypothetical protein